MVKTNIRQLIDRYYSLQWCRENIVVPIGIETNNATGSKLLTIAIGNFSYLATIGDFIKQRAASTGLECQFVERPAHEIQALLDQATQERLITAESNSLEGIEFTVDAVLDALKGADDESEAQEFEFDFDDSDEQVIEEETTDLSAEMIGSKIQQCCEDSYSCDASWSFDIHVEPRREEYKIRVRRDGVMQSYVSMPRSAGIKFIACLKNMAQMDIAERRASQDGKIRRKFEGEIMEFRCATAPGKFGEKMVMRFLNSNTDMLSLDTLISNETVRQDFRSIINEANGIIIVSRPTGSSKSTTLASALREKDTGELNIVTAEDPIEYDLGGNIQQFPVIRAKGQTFQISYEPSYVRIRCILIGETCDPETAESLWMLQKQGTLSSQHPRQQCIKFINTLMDMKVPGYKLDSALRGVLAQRLLRKVCPECCTQRPINEAESKFTTLPIGTPVCFASALTAEEKQKCKEEGSLCNHCGGTGYKGRVGTYELLKLNKATREAIRQEKSAEEIEEIAQENGMLTLKTYAADLIAKQLQPFQNCRKS